MQRLIEFKIEYNNSLKIDRNVLVNNTSFQKLIIKNNKIEKIENDAFQNLNNLVELEIIKNDLEVIEDGLFDSLQNLNKLFLGDNKIHTIKVNAFKELSKLTELSLSKNCLVQIKNGLFENQRDLKILLIKENSINRIEKNAFNNLENLKLLSVAANKLEQIHYDLFDKLKQLKILKLDNNQLTSICNTHLKSLSNLQKLHLSGNQLKSIENGLFTNLGNLLELNLNDNLIEQISATSFFGLTKLKILNLAQNKLKVVPNLVFKDLLNLEKLNLRDNQINELQIKAFSQLHNLATLDLSFNQLKQFHPDLIASLENLGELNLCGNQIEEVGDFNRNKLLDTLDLSRNNIIKLKIDNREPSNLLNLLLKNNYIDEIENGVFQKYPRLKKLDLSGNKLKKLSNGVFNGLGSLNQLLLDNNLIAEVDNNVLQNLVNLEKLSLAQNKLKNIEIGLLKNNSKLSYVDFDRNEIENAGFIFSSGLEQLKEIKLSDNLLSRINKKLIEFSALENLDLSKNKFYKLEANEFAGFSNLQSLQLQHNQITEIRNGVFENLEKLQYLDLSGNKLTAIVKETFLGLPGLKILLLNSNLISKIAPEMLEILSGLTRLSLSKNKLQVIGEKTFEKQTSLQELNLDDNQIHCIDNNAFSSLSALEVLSMVGNRLRNIDKKVFKSLKNLMFLNLHENQLESEGQIDPHVPNFDFRGLKNLLFIDFSFNNFQTVSISLGESCSRNIFVNLSSNELTSLPTINPVENLEIHVNIRFNKIYSINPSHKANGISFDVRNNFLTCQNMSNLKKCNIRKREYFILKEKKTRDHLKEIKFESYRNLSFKWKPIPNFSVITGKNGVGKSSALNYIIEMYSVKKEEAGESSANTFVPVIFKMHDTIKTHSIANDSFEEILAKIASKEASENFKFVTTNAGKVAIKPAYFKTVIRKNIAMFSIRSLDELIFQFKNKINLLNKHLTTNDFKYTIELKSDDEIWLSNRFNGQKVPLNNSSPGEQLKIMFYIWEFALSRLEIIHTPILLLDEPDAHLHPKAVHEFVGILYKLADAGAQIIMTTHNPTTISFIDKMNLFCMKETKRGIEIMPANSDADIIEELTDNLVIVNLPYRVVFVEGTSQKTRLNKPRYQLVEKDALFYSKIVGILNRIGFSFDFQFVFKSLVGHSNIVSMMKNLQEHFIYEDHLGIIDNDNYFEVQKNDTKLVKEYYGERRKVFNLLRNGLENYALDPVNLFCYLNRLRKIGFGVNEKAHKDFLNKITPTATAYLESIDTIDKLLKNEKLQDILQSIVNVLSQTILSYLTEFGSLTYGLFEWVDKSSIRNLIPTFRFFYEKSEKNCKNKKNIDLFDSVKYCKDLFYKKKWPKDFKAELESRLSILEPGQKKNETDPNGDVPDDVLKDLKDEWTKIGKNQFEKIETNGLFEHYQQLLKYLKLNTKVLIDVKLDKSKDRRTFIKSRLEKIKKQKKFPKDLRDYLEIAENETLLVDYIDVKFGLDKFLVEKFKNELDKRINCHFIIEKNKTIEIMYPYLFYLMNGHFYDEIIQSIFFNPPHQKARIIKEIVKPDGLMQSCGYLIPNELGEIFEKINHFKVDYEDFKEAFEWLFQL